MTGPQRATPTYSDVASLLTGDTSVSSLIQNKHVINASNEIDSILGFRYTIPFTADSVSPQGWLLIERIANNLASGRLLLEITTPVEGMNVHKYGESLIADANAALQMILNGQIDLSPSVQPEDPAASNLVMVGNQDGGSMVEGFYQGRKRDYYRDQMGLPRYPYVGNGWGAGF